MNPSPINPRARVRAWVHNGRVQLRDVVELYFLPLLAVVLPWPWCFALYKRCARSAWLYRQAGQRALEQAQALGWVAPAPDLSGEGGVVNTPNTHNTTAPAALPSAADWLAQRKLVTLVDHADHYLVRTRSARWLQRYMEVRGQWPQAGKAAVLCTFHWGAGMWCLRHARRAGLAVHALAAPLEGAHFAGRPVLHAYAKARTACAGHEMGYPTIDAAQSMRPVLKALKAGEQILAVVDVPPDAVSASVEVPLLGRAARVPRGLLRLAAEQGLPVAVFVVGIDLTTGRRYLHIHNMPTVQGMDADALTRDVFAHLQAAIEREPAAWHFWAEAPRFFVDASLSG